MTIPPILLPGPLVATHRARSRALLHWRARDCSLTPLTGQTPTFSRAGPASYLPDSVGGLVRATYGQPLWTALDFERDGARENFLAIAAAQNLYNDFSMAFSSWSVTGSPAVTVFEPLGEGSLFRILSPAGSADFIGRSHAGGSLFVLGDGDYPVSVLVKQGFAPGQTRIQVWDSTAAANRLLARFSWTAGVPNDPTMDAGAFLYKRHLGGGLWLMSFVTATATAANTHFTYVFPQHTGGTPADLMIAGYWLGFGPSGLPPFPNATSTSDLAVVADSMALGLDFAPPRIPSDEATIYFKVVPWNNYAAGENASLLYLHGLYGFGGSAALAADDKVALAIYAGGPSIGMSVELAVGNASVQAATASLANYPSIVIEGIAQLRAQGDGTHKAYIELANGSNATTPTGQVIYGKAWRAQSVTFGKCRSGIDAGTALYQSLKYLHGRHSLAAARMAV